MTTTRIQQAEAAGIMGGAAIGLTLLALLGRLGAGTAVGLSLRAAYGVWRALRR